MPFAGLKLIEPLLKAVQAEGYTVPTAIQTQAIPHLLGGKDLLGCAQTGTGKTAAFALPILQRLSHRPGGPSGQRGSHGQDRRRPIRAMILTPTRELAAQIHESFTTYGRHLPLRATVIFGGVGQGAQVQALRKGVDILVATPGRLLDLLQQRHLTLQQVEIFVLDEADRMLDMGFIHDIRRVIAQLPPRRQTLLFSATMPREIRALADTLLHQPVEVKIAAESPAADTVHQSLYHIAAPSKPVLLEHLLEDLKITRALVFTRTKYAADKVAKRLCRRDVPAEAIHSNKSQNARIRALANFRAGKIRVLVASDIAARGLDVDDISHVINYDLPHEPETYIHRIGRTGRAGARGQAISFCSDEQRDLLKSIEKLLGRKIPVAHPTVKLPPPPAAHAAAPAPAAGHAGTHAGHRSSHGQPAASQSAKPATPAPAAGHAGTHAGHKPAHTHPAAKKPARPPTPQQHKDSFWKNKRKPHRGR